MAQAGREQTLRAMARGRHQQRQDQQHAYRFGGFADAERDQDQEDDPHCLHGHTFGCRYLRIQGGKEQRAQR